MKTTPLLVSFVLLLFSTGSYAQCSILASAVPGITLVHQNTNCFNNSGVAYNPNLGLYYACRAGNSGFPYETWDAAGTPLFNTTTGNDFRGLWWNPTLNTLEGNSYNSMGIWKTTLNGSGYATSAGSYTLASGQPNAQSCGDLDWQAYEIIYYNSGSIYRYSRSTGAALGSYPITGTPVALSNLNLYTAMYTGCTGKEIALLDYVNKAVYFYNKATGAYAGMSQLPASAVTTNAFRVSWANNLIWLFNLANYTWYSYQVLTAPLPIVLTAFTAACNDGVITFNWTTESETDNNFFTIEMTMDGMHYDAIGTVHGAGNSSQPIDYNYKMTEPVNGKAYYRLKQTDYNGDATYSDEISAGCEKDEQAVSIYPNPANNETYVYGCQPGDVISVFDATGRKMYEGTATEQTRFEISLEGFVPGIYQVQVSSDARTIHQQLIIR